MSFFSSSLWKDIQALPKIRITTFKLVNLKIKNCYSMKHLQILILRTTKKAGQTHKNAR